MMRIFLLTLLLMLASLWNLTLGPVALEWHEILDSDSLSYQLFWDLRAPRTLQALFSGLLLALTGAVAQSLFRNPLADPSLVGVSAGSAFGAVTFLVLGTSLFGLAPGSIQYLVPLASFVGGLLTTLLILRLANRYQGVAMTGVLLVGMAVNAIAIAWIGGLKYFADDRALRESTFWLMGQFGQTAWWQILLLAIVSVLLSLMLLGRAQKLNIWLLGDSEARHLGIDVNAMRWQLVLLASLGVAVVVAFAGLVGFVGLMVPHLVRTWTGPDNRKVLPESALVGALLLVFADGLSRVILAPAELPVGILTALAGGPFFLFLIHLRYRGAGHV
jgi:iron complex transport system permease protein